MKVSFDFDGTLSRRGVQEFAKELVSGDHDVWIVTSRFSTEEAKKRAWWWIEKQNQQLYDVAKECGIPRDKIVFTNGKDKIGFLKGECFAFHLDDDECELLEILESQDPCQPVNVNHFDWLETCKEILNKNLYN